MSVGGVHRVNPSWGCRVSDSGHDEVGLHAGTVDDQEAGVGSEVR
jgi:hypothetical protein